MTIYGFTGAEQDLEVFYREKASRTLKYLELAGHIFAAERDYLEDATTLRQKVDRLLEKVSATGLASLSPEERRFLEDASRRFDHLKNDR